MEHYPRPRSCASTSPGSLERALALLLEHTGQRVRAGIRSRHTLEMQEGHARWLLEQLGAACLLVDLTSARLHELAERWLAAGGAEGRPIALRTLAKRLSTLRRAIRLACVRGELDRMPLFPEIGLPPHRPRMRILHNHAELRRVLEALPPERADWVQAAVWTCQRPGDVERMRWADVGLDGAPPWMVIRSTKTRRPHGIRVKMPGPMVSAMLARRDRLVAAGRPPAPTDPLVARWPGRSRVLPLVCVRLGLPPMSAIDFRHTGFSWMIRRVGITRAAQEWGGWSDFAMLSKYYAHALPPQLAQAAEELESIVDEPAHNDNEIPVGPGNDNGRR